MSEEKELKQAKAVYKALCDMLDDNKWHYQKDEENLSISCSARGDDLAIDLRIEVDIQRQLVMLLSKMPFAVPESKRIAVAIAVSVANDSIVDGSFDYDLLSGNIVFRMTSSYRESIIGKQLLDYMLGCSCVTIDEYNDRFLAVAKNEMSSNEIVEFIRK